MKSGSAHKDKNKMAGSPPITTKKNSMFKRAETSRFGDTKKKIDLTAGIHKLIDR